MSLKIKSQKDQNTTKWFNCVLEQNSWICIAVQKNPPPSQGEIRSVWRPIKDYQAYRQAGKCSPAWGEAIIIRLKPTQSGQRA